MPAALAVQLSAPALVVICRPLAVAASITLGVVGCTPSTWVLSTKLTEFLVTAKGCGVGTTFTVASVPAGIGQVVGSPATVAYAPSV